MLDQPGEAKSKAYRHFDLRPLAGSLGAEISHVDLSRIDDAAFEEIHRAFIDYQALIFRDQDLSNDQFLAFARRLGRDQALPLHEGARVPS